VKTLNKHKVRQAIVLTSPQPHRKQCSWLCSTHIHLLFLPLLLGFSLFPNPFQFTHWVTDSICLGAVREPLLASGVLSVLLALEHRLWTLWSPQTAILTYTKPQTFTLSLHTNFSAIQIKLGVAVNFIDAGRGVKLWADPTAVVLYVVWVFSRSLHC
jgi:hypothetical protein